MSDTQPAGTPDPDRWSALADYHGLFAGGPPRRLTALVALPVPICRTGGSRLLLVLMLGWDPPALLTMLDMGVRTAAERLAHNFEAPARPALAAPLLVLAIPVSATPPGPSWNT